MYPAKIYYAHSMKIYGSEREAYELKFIKKTYPKSKIINPAELKDLKGMKKFLKIVRKCSLVVASELDGYVGKGVFSEIARAFSNNAYVSVIREKDNDLSLSEVIGIQIINNRDWKIKYAKLKIKK